MQRLTVILLMLGMLAWGSAIVLAEHKAAASPPSITQPASQPASRPATQPAKVTEKITIAGEEFSLEIAANEAAREKGLMDRRQIDDHGGMIFIWPAAESRTFWMKNCPMDIDVMFLDGRGRIVAIHAMKSEVPQRLEETNEDYEARLKRYDSLKPAQFAIELTPGTIDRLQIKTGHLARADWKRCVQHCQPSTTSAKP